MSSQDRSLAARIEDVKRQLAALGEMRPGSLSTQYNVCGSTGCRCKASPPRKHGPYYQVSYTRKGKSGTRFVRKEDLPSIRRELKTYARMRALVDRWIELAMKLSDLRLAKQRRRAETPSQRDAGAKPPP
jgi:uncharacterized protein DUF6788